MLYWPLLRFFCFVKANKAGKGVIGADSNIWSRPVRPMLDCAALTPFPFTAATEVEKADYVAALRRMEPGRRNSFYSRVQNDGELIRRAVKLAKDAN